MSAMEAHYLRRYLNATISETRVTIIILKNINSTNCNWFALQLKEYGLMTNCQQKEYKSESKL